MSSNYYLTRETNFYTGAKTKVLVNNKKEEIAWFHDNLGWSGLKEKLKNLAEDGIEVVEL